MPEIKSIKATTNVVSLFLLEIIDQIESGEICADNIMLAMKEDNGDWATAYHNMDFGMRQEGLGHQQADVIDSMIRANPERYIREK